jgi:hypothetical protein
VRGKDIFKLTNGKESSHEINNDNWVTPVKLAIPKYLTSGVKSSHIIT